MEDGWHKTRQKWRRDGASGVARAVMDAATHRWHRWRDARIDRRFGIGTAGVRYDLAALGADGRHVAHATGYEPIQLTVFSRIVRALPDLPAQREFLDYGSGKGRALVLAAEAGFRRVTGIEFAPALHEAAQANIAAYRRRRPAAPPLEARLADATDVDPPRAAAVLFFYNPFDEVVMGKVLARLEAAWRDHGSDWVIVYRTPRHAALLDAHAWLAPVAQTPSFRIWRTRPLRD